MHLRYSGPVDLGAPKSYMLTGEVRYGKNKDELLDKIDEKLKEFRGNWDVGQIHITFSEEDIAFRYKAEYVVTLLENDDGKEV